ncbi:dihydropteroate synthase [Burkholderiales bacterium]|nr:dihydropteroate synthase [Burkholderiales bacterium]
MDVRFSQRMDRNCSWGTRRFHLNRPLIMGVLNVTPDSFSDGGEYLDPLIAVKRGQRLFEEGADIIDVGGESTRPGAKPVTISVERSRVLPVISGLTQLGIPVSIDTQKPNLMEEAIDSGACLVNDISGAQTPEVATLVARTGVGICVMHMQGAPDRMQKNPGYDDVIREVFDFLSAKVTTLIRAGVSSNQIVIDPGFGFGKKLEHNIALLRHLDRFREIGRPILVGLSRKSMLGFITEKQDPTDRLGSSIAAAIFAFVKGADIVRVHDVNETRDALVAWQFMSDKPNSEESQ